MNILVNSINTNYADDWISRVLSNINIDNCAIIFMDRKFEEKCKSKSFATHIFHHLNLKEADYSDYEELYIAAPPVDPLLLEEMAQYESQVFWMMERHISVEFNARWTQYIEHLRFWNYVLTCLKIDVFFSPDTPHEIYDYIIFCLCKIKSIKYVSGLTLSYKKRYHLLLDVYNQLPNFQSEYGEMLRIYNGINIDDIRLREDISEMYNFYTGQGDRTPYYMKKSKSRFDYGYYHYFFFIYRNFALVRILANIIKKKPDDKYARRFWDIYKRLLSVSFGLFNIFSFSEKTYRLSEKNIYKNRLYHEDDIAFNFYNKNIDDVDYEKKYIYVPLHMQPENTSSPLGGIFVDQALMIEMLSFYLPPDWFLYVKENPKQITTSFGYSIRGRSSSYRTIRFYERIKKCNNVKLVSLEEDTYKLLDNARAVATLTGTAGLEAITHGIPWLMFGYSCMQYAPNVYTIRSNDDCRNAMKSIQATKKVDDEYYKKIKIFFKTLENYVGITTPEYVTIKSDSKEEIEKCKKVISDMYINKLNTIFL